VSVPPSDRSSGIPRAGEVVAGRYEVERVLGVGGMGVVLAARHVQLGQRVAIKFIRGEVAPDSSAVSRFLREAHAAVALSSEHVTRVLDAGTLESGAPYMVMEYLDGVDLSEVLRRNGVMAIPEAIGAVLQACEAIAEAHTKGIVHRDLKPSNLFVTRRVDGTPLIKVLDFGISKMADRQGVANANLTGSGSIMGSPSYMSPEQVRSVKAVDGRSDIWAIGVILYEVLTGVSPFEGETLGDTFARIVGEDPVPIRTRRPEVPDGLSKVIGECLERKVDQRIQTVGHLAAKLLPFAPRDSALLVERILRMSGTKVSGTLMGETTVEASGPMNSALFEPTTGRSSADGTRESKRVETESPWLRSGATESPRRTSRVGSIAIIAGGSILLAGLMAGILLVRGRMDPKAGAASESSVAATPSPPTPPAATVPALPLAAAAMRVAPGAQAEPDPGGLIDAAVPTRRIVERPTPRILPHAAPAPAPPADVQRKQPSDPLLEERQ
jgi:serine/threonine protein kinase